MEFKGSYEDLQALVAQLGLEGKWTEGGNNSRQFRTTDGAVIDWWPTTGRIRVQGKQAAKRNCESGLTALFEAAATSNGRAGSPKKRIFVVHGHDSVAREQLELVLHKLGLEPFVLMNTSGGGMTIIEALEQHIGKSATSAFGIVLLTPDDVGYALRDGEKEKKPRARQNVILEMGMLLASLTRERVAILQKQYVEIPSDASGIIYLHFNEHVKEVVPKLAERLQSCGFDLTPMQIASASS